MKKRRFDERCIHRAGRVLYDTFESRSLPVPSFRARGRILNIRREERRGAARVVYSPNVARNIIIPLAAIPGLTTRWLLRIVTSEIAK